MVCAGDVQHHRPGAAVGRGGAGAGAPRRPRAPLPQGEEGHPDAGLRPAQRRRHHLLEEAGAAAAAAAVSAEAGRRAGRGRGRGRPRRQVSGSRDLREGPSRRHQLRATDPRPVICARTAVPPRAHKVRSFRDLFEMKFCGWCRLLLSLCAGIVGFTRFI